MPFVVWASWKNDIDITYRAQDMNILPEPLCERFSPKTCNVEGKSILTVSKQKFVQDFKETNELMVLVVTTT